MAPLDPPLPACSRGERPDFAEVYEEYLPKLTRYVAANMPRDTVQSPEDLAQDALLKAWRTWDPYDYRGPGALHAWLYTIALNLIRDKHRHNRLVQFRPIDASPAAWRLTSQDPRAAPEDSLLHKERAAESRRALARALPALTAHQRLILLAHLHQGHPLASIAASLGTTSGACKSAIHYARAKCRALLATPPSPSDPHQLTDKEPAT